MIAAFATFLIGCLAGFLIDLIPHAIAVAMRIDLCRESCPSWFRSGSILVYIGMPLAWGALAVFILRRSTGRTRFKTMVFAFAASLILIVPMTWGAYAYQAGILK